MKRAILTALVPGAVGLISSIPYSKSSNFIEWWNSCKKPDWAPKSLYTYACMDALTITPVGYASYFIYKYGGGLNNALTALSLGLYGSNLMLCSASLSFMKKKDIKAVYYFSIAVHLTATGSAIIAYKINRCTGLLMVPYVLWTGFYTFTLYVMKNLNSEIKN
ncbi:hypothetical protein LOAG_05565 [Loa loa]|uniref:TspO protein n=1 Tax=Loa loa TaxID=7209 RepID=A0A1I7VE89_LOALO|nr:hypothetical protein LOAG_05565 [Loa loa]EFO22915.1 hypothetical protein LOAG_05565 [Loa loa]